MDSTIRKKDYLIRADETLKIRFHVVRENLSYADRENQALHQTSYL